MTVISYDPPEDGGHLTFVPLPRSNGCRSYHGYSVTRILNKGRSCTEVFCT